MVHIRMYSGGLSAALTSSEISPGDVIFVRGGTYLGGLRCTISGESGKPITIKPYPRETVVIDGVDRSATGLRIDGSYIVVSGLEIKNAGDGVVALGKHITLDNLYVHHCGGSGILLRGDNGTAKNNRVFYNSMMHEFGAGDAWASGISAARYPQNCLITGNTVWGNWGEGISTFETMYTTISRNVVYDNQHNLYLSDTKYSSVVGNLSYCTPGNPVGAYFKQTGLYIGDELGVPVPLGVDGVRELSSNNLVANNLLVKNTINLLVVPEHCQNNLIAHNTIADPYSDQYGPMGLFFYNTPGDFTFCHNLIIGADITTIANNLISPGIVLARNLWSTSPRVAWIGEGDVIANPQIDDSYKPGALSPARLLALPNERIAVDYGGNPRGVRPTVGAWE